MIYVVHKIIDKQSILRFLYIEFIMSLCSTITLACRYEKLTEVYKRITGYFHVFWLQLYCNWCSIKRMSTNWQYGRWSTDAESTSSGASRQRRNVYRCQLKSVYRIQCWRHRIQTTTPQPFARYYTTITPWHDNIAINVVIRYSFRYCVDRVCFLLNLY